MRISPPPGRFVVGVTVPGLKTESTTAILHHPRGEVCGLASGFVYNFTPGFIKLCMALEFVTVVELIGNACWERGLQ